MPNRSLSTKESARNARDTGSISGSGRSPGGGHGNPLQYSCLENPMDRGAWQVQSVGSQRVRQSKPAQHRTGNFKTMLKFLKGINAFKT